MTSKPRKSPTPSRLVTQQGPKEEHLIRNSAPLMQSANDSCRTHLQCQMVHALWLAPHVSHTSMALKPPVSVTCFGFISATHPLTPKPTIRISHDKKLEFCNHCGIAVHGYDLTLVFARRSAQAKGASAMVRPGMRCSAASYCQPSPKMKSSVSVGSNIPRCRISCNSRDSREDSCCSRQSLTW